MGDPLGRRSAIAHRRCVAAAVTACALVALLILSAAPAGAAYQLVTKWGSYGSGDDRFILPGGVATDAADNVYVADSRNAQIKKFDSSGSFIGKWGGGGRFERPWGIATDAAGNVYVSDPLANRVQKFDSDGEFITKWGGGGSGDGEFGGPTGVATDTRGSVYVVEAFANNRVQKFDSDGNFITRWGVWGWAGDGEFTYPWALTADSSGNVYVTDWGCPRVQKFDSSGRFATKWGAKGSGDGEFEIPNGLATDSRNNVYVADTGNHRIQKFADLTQTTITSAPLGGTLDNAPSFAFSADRPGCTFECSLGFAPYASCTSPVAAPTLADGPNRFRVRAEDRNGVIDPTAAVENFRVISGVDGYAAARKTQAQRHRRIIVKVRVRAGEKLTIRARGSIKLKAAYRLRRQAAELGGGQSKKLKLRPTKRRNATRIARALRGGKKAKAKLKLKLTDAVGNKRTDRLKVKLKR